MLRNTQTFSTALIYEVQYATPGCPRYKETVRYKERTVGLTRRNFARQDNVVIRYVLRCPLLRDVSAQDVAIPNDGKQYRIWDVQYPEDINPPVMDLTLEELNPVYDIYDGGEPVEP